MKSENINELAAALAKAQSKIIGALKDSSNPFFKSSYADLASVWDAIRGPLSENGLAVSQCIGIHDGPNGEICEILQTTLMHSSGQWIDSFALVKPVKNDPQSQGSAITYMRRYALAAITGCPQIDDDGNLATRATPEVKPQVVQAKKPLAEKIQEAFPNAKVKSYSCNFGKYKGKNLQLENPTELLNYVKYLNDSAREKGKELSPPILEFIAEVEKITSLGKIPF